MQAPTTDSTSPSWVRSAARRDRPPLAPIALGQLARVIGRPRDDEDLGRPRPPGPRRRRGDAGRAGDQADSPVETGAHRSSPCCSGPVLVARRASARTIAPPMPTATAPASRNARALEASTPPVGISSISGSGPRISRISLRTNSRRRKELDERRAEIPRGAHLSRRQRARDERQAHPRPTAATAQVEYAARRRSPRRRHAPVQSGRADRRVPAPTR